MKFDPQAAAAQAAKDEKRKIVLRELQQLPYSTVSNILQIIGVLGDRSDYFRTCITCLHFESIDGMSGAPPKERCKKFNVLPPAKVIADGCSEYLDFDDIPF